MSLKRWPLRTKTRQGMGFEAGLMSPAAGGNQASDGGQAADPEMLLRAQEQHVTTGKFTKATTQSLASSTADAAGHNSTKFEVGDEVKSKSGGSGVVSSIEDGILTVKTDDGKTEKWQAVLTEKRETMSTNIEIRYASKMTVEERGDQGDEMALVGYAATYNSLSKPLPQGFVEKIAPGAFNRALAEKQDCRCLFNHDSSRVLGRVSSGTLKLSSDDKGLKFRCALDPNQQAHRDLYAAVKRGDISDCSFAFSPNGEDGHDFDDVRQQDGSWLMIRTLKDVNLYDVSAVTHPAYNDTSVQARDAAMTPEIRSIVNKLLEKRAQSEKRDAFDCLEDYICEIGKALAAKFPCEATADGCCSSYGLYYILETHVDHVIACNNYGPGPQEFVSIPYVISPDGDGFVFGTPTPMEKEYVPAERTAQKVAEHRAMHSGHMQAIADQHAAAAAEHNAMSDAHAAASTEHSAHAAAHQEVADDAAKEAERMKKCEDSDGDCAVKGCRCQNCMVDARDVDDDFDDADYGDDIGDDDDKKHDDESDDDWRARKLKNAETRAAKKAAHEVRKHARYAENRDAGDKKVLTKKVGGKNLPASAFASVGDPNDTSTWKLPVHDKAHADNAAARLNQTNDIDKDAAEKKIKAAQKKFGEDTSNRDLSPMTPEEVEDTLNRLRLIAIDSEVRIG